MSMKNRRSNREAKKLKQNMPKIVVSTSPFAFGQFQSGQGHHRQAQVA
jgi:hypothetical protein